jgi:hypothetical protein
MRTTSLIEDELNAQLFCKEITCHEQLSCIRIKDPKRQHVLMDTPKDENVL